MKWHATRWPGIVVRHKMIGQRGNLKPCPAETGGRCRCDPSYRVRYRDKDKKACWSTVFAEPETARKWQAVRAETAKAKPTGITFQELADQFFERAYDGRVSTRSGERYSKRALDIYTANLKNHVHPSYGDRIASSLTVLDWQMLVDELAVMKLKYNTLQVILSGVRAVYRWACSKTRRLLDVNETRGLEMPAKDETPRDRIATGSEARQLIAALNEPTDRVEFGLALYAGMRNVERWGMEWDRHVTFADGRPHGIRITRDITKSKAGVRTLPVIALLRPILMREWLRQGKPTSGPVIRGPRGGDPKNTYTKMMARVSKAWEANGLQRITPHEARHTFASYLIAAMVSGGKSNMKVVQVLMGHSTIQETYDRYGHLFPGHEADAAHLLDAYLGVPERETEAVSV